MPRMKPPAMPNPANPGSMDAARGNGLSVRQANRNQFLKAQGRDRAFDRQGNSLKNPVSPAGPVGAPAPAAAPAPRGVVPTASGPTMMTRTAAPLQGIPAGPKMQESAAPLEATRTTMPVTPGRTGPLPAPSPYADGFNMRRGRTPYGG